MKYINIITLFAVAFFCGTVLFAEDFRVNWGILQSGSWEEFSPSSGTLHNRLELRLDLFMFNLRGQILDRRPLHFNLEPSQGNPDRQVTNYLGGLYHKSSGSRLLIGALDEWGLSARIRNPWIRSPPYAENHKPLIADLKTAASVTKNDEAYLYLSSPFLTLSSDVRIRGFISAQTEINDIESEYKQTAASAGLEFSLPNKSVLLAEAFYTTATLPPSKSSSWFSYPPPLPEREFNLYAAGLLYSTPFISISSDFALSETYAWGTDIYANLGISLSPLLSAGRISRPLTISFAADGAGEMFVYRDGSGNSAGFRTALRINWRGRYNSLIRLNSTLRGSGLGDDFYRSSTNFYWRLPSVTSNSSFIRLTRISISADRNAENPGKINDRLYGYIGFSLNFQQFGLKTPFGVVFNGSVRGISASEDRISVYPILSKSHTFDDCAFYSEVSWSPLNFQFRTRLGYSNNAKNEQKWDYSISATARIKHRYTNGRLSIKAASPRFPDKWNFTLSWRMEI